MPTPSPPPTPAQIISVSDITQLSVEVVAEMVASDSDQGISNAKWEMTLANIEAWQAIDSDYGDIKRVGDIEFFSNADRRSPFDLINAIRRRYGQSELAGLKPQTDILTTVPYF